MKELNVSDVIIYKFGGLTGSGVINCITERYIIITPFEYERGTTMILLHDNIKARITTRS